ncbi:MAG: V-type ATP synthase subunit A [Candidatus Marsarchaeota archaeon]|nr:V-type ATP synthase subunit A [Candidatus Marsarchaeota archaeon]
MSGSIYRVSGPVVIASGLENPNMYDVVRVGNEELIGEIIKLEKGMATVQVYEDTSGLRPGDVVKSTGMQLSVMLAPGLVGSIFDGIQRPLDKIRAASGDFIARGINVESLDTKKKWALKSVQKKGAHVKTGDIIAEVEETSLIKHKVMVPHGVSGTIASITDGEYTIEEPFASIKTDSGKNVDISMLQKWPVRMPRPVRDKLPMEVPLITGQRVVDTMFPVAKGGTAAVPGPFGSGKCVTGDTPVMLSDGSIANIESVDDHAASLGITRGDASETLAYSSRSVGLFSFTNNRISESSSSTFYKGKSSTVVRIRTRTGKTVKVTPVHKLFKISGDGKIVETMAKDLSAGDYIASARRIETNFSDQAIDPYEIGGMRAMDNETQEFASKLARHIGHMKIATVLSRTTLESLARRTKTVTPKLEWIKEMCRAVGAPLPEPHLFVGDRRSNAIKLPRKVDPYFSEFVGYIVSEGYTRGPSTVVFTNTDEEVLNRFVYLAKRVFGINGKIERQSGKAPNVLLFSRVLVEFLWRIGTGSLATGKRIPEIIMRSSNDSLAAFLTSYFIGDGSTSGGEVEFCTASYDLQVQLSYVLARFGIIHTLADKHVDGSTYYRIFVRGIANLKLLSAVLTGSHRKVTAIAEYIASKDSAFDSIDVVPLSPATISDLYRGHATYNKLLESSIEISNYIGNGEHMGTNTFRKFAAAIGATGAGDMQQLTYINELAAALDYIYCDRIVSIEELEGPFDVYDVSLPEFGSNFIGGTGGLVLHNTVIQHQLAKWSDADLIVYVGCGERGNEMTEILTTFPELNDPKTGKPLMDRTILIANTSNMPVAAREASIYTAITLAEYYRDMGYDVALMADSTSRWAEALREISGRLEEMPGEEGYPAYLGRKIAEFYERAGRVHVLNGSVGSITAIGAVSPPGGDISEPVSQNTLRVTRVFWALDASLANARHFPSINWLNSYSLYTDDLAKWYEVNISPDWAELYKQAMATLQKEAEINEIVQLVGYDALPEHDKVVLDTAKSLREDFLQQNAFDEVDTYSSMKKQYLMLKSILHVGDEESLAVDHGVPAESMAKLEVKQKVAKMKFVPEAQIEDYAKEISKLAAGMRNIKVSNE